MIVIEKGEPCVGLSEVQAYARVETGEEEAILAGLLRVASEMCEGFLGFLLVRRSFREVVTGGASNKLKPRPVRSVSVVRELTSGVALSADNYAIVIDDDGLAVVTGLAPGLKYEIDGEAGEAGEPNEVPEPIRQGILRLCVHLFANRDGPAGELPRAVTALWRPYRRLGLSR